MGSLAPRLLGDGDTGWHIRNGELILSTHTITRVDPFSSTMHGQPWYAWEWLYDVAIARLHGWYGLNGVVFGSAFIIAITFSLMFILAQRRGGSLVGTILLSLLAITASSIHFLARPHILSWLLTLFWFHLLDSSETNPSGGNKLFFLPILMLLWVNVHGGFVIGFVLLAIYGLTNLATYRRSKNLAEREVAGKRLWRIILVGIASGLASLVEPVRISIACPHLSLSDEPFSDEPDQRIPGAEFPWNRATMLRAAGAGDDRSLCLEKA